MQLEHGVTDNTAFTASTTTTYEVTEQMAIVRYRSVAVNVNAVPQANGILQTVCDGTDVTLSGSGSTYTWDNGITDNTAFTQMQRLPARQLGQMKLLSNTDQVTVTVNTLPQ